MNIQWIFHPCWVRHGFSLSTYGRKSGRDKREVIFSSCHIGQNLSPVTHTNSKKRIKQAEQMQKLRGCLNSPHCRPNSAEGLSGDCRPDATQIYRSWERSIQMGNQNAWCSFHRHLFTRVVAKQVEGYPSPSTWKKPHATQVVKACSCGTVRRLWELPRWKPHAKHTPLERAQCASQRADHQLTTCVQVLTGCLWLLWEAKRRGAERFPPSGKSLTHDM